MSMAEVLRASYGIDNADTFTWHVDPGHAWLQVSIELLRKLKVHDISGYSYLDGKHGLASLYAYLEEDCDAGLFIDAWGAANPGKEIKFKERFTNNDSPIRKMKHYGEY